MKEVINDSFIKLMFNILKKHMTFTMIYYFYSKERKLKKLVTNSHDKTEYAVHIRNLKQALHHELVLKKN